MDLNEALQTLIETAQEAATERPTIEDVNGLNYVRRDEGFELLLPPLPERVKMHSPTSICDYIASELDKGTIDENGLAVLVESPQSVKVIGQARDDGRRIIYAEAKPVAPDGVEPGLDHYQSMEPFKLWLLQHFENSQERADLLSLVGNVRSGEVHEVDDDGISQQLTTTRGKVGLAREQAKVLWDLIPRRSFPEVKLDAVTFVLRAKPNSEDRQPMMGLWESDGGRWRIDAMAKAKAVLEAGRPKDAIWKVFA